MNYGLLAGCAMLAQPLLMRIMKGKMSGLFSSGAIRFETVHQIAGRRRCRSQWLKDQDVADKVLEIVRAVRGVNNASVNTSTGSLLIEYDENCSGTVDAALLDIEKSAAAPEVASRVSAAAQKSAKHGPGFMPKCIAGGFGADLFGSAPLAGRTPSYKKIIGTVFLAYGAYKMVKGREFPAGPQLLWWGYHLLNIDKE